MSSGGRARLTAATTLSGQLASLRISFPLKLTSANAWGVTFAFQNSDLGKKEASLDADFACFDAIKLVLPPGPNLGCLSPIILAI